MSQMDESPSVEVTIPPYHAMFWPTLKALKALGDSGSNMEIEDRASLLMDLSDSQINRLHLSGPQTEVRYRMAWARTYLKKVGAVENSGVGVWSITDYGQSLQEADMNDVVSIVRAMTPSKKSKSNKSIGTEIEVNELVSDSSWMPEEPTTLDWREELLMVLQNMSPGGFEKLCQRLLRESGFTKVDVTGRSGDGGIDGVGVLRIALLSFQVFFQCKRYRGNVGSSAIRDFRGAMVGRTDKGLLITTGSFTVDAKREATRDGAPVLDLIDGDALCFLLKDLKLGVTTELVEAIKIDSTWFSTL